MLEVIDRFSNELDKRFAANEIELGYTRAGAYCGLGQSIPGWYKLRDYADIRGGIIWLGELELARPVHTAGYELA